jgi:predicted NBD/HSP70 family sugar kinase
LSEANERLRDVAVVGRGIQPMHVRQTNQRAILSVISLQPGVSNAELARITDLAPQTVSSVLVDLENHHLVTRGEVLRGKRGQPATPVFMNPMGAFCIGAEIGWRHIEVCLVGIGTQVIASRRRDYDYPDATAIFAELAGIVKELCATLSPAERKRVTGLGLAAPSSICNAAENRFWPKDQRLLWEATDVAAACAQATGLKVSSFNDGHAACWAQRVAHPAPRPLSFVFVMLDTCVAAGIVAENRLWEGVHGASGNLGAMLITDRDGHTRFVHEVASLHALETRLHAVSLDLTSVSGTEVNPKAAPILDDWIADASDAIAQAFINTTRVMEFESAVIESALPPAITQRIVDETRRHIERFPKVGAGHLPVIAGHIGKSGAAQGAALLRMHRQFFSRELAHMSA